MPLRALLLPRAPRRSRLRVAGIAAFSGGWGILTGFALFVCLSQATEGIEGAAGLWALGGNLIAAVCVASVVEYLRELAAGHRAEAGHRRRKTVASVLSSVLLLILFELCIMAFEDVSKAGLESGHTLSSLVERVTGREAPLMLLYNETRVRDGEGLRRELERELQREGNPPSPQRRMLEYLSTEDQWALFPTTVPDAAFFIRRAVAQHRAETANILERFRNSGWGASAGSGAGSNAGPNAGTAPTREPTIMTSSAYRIDEGCGIAVKSSRPKVPEIVGGEPPSAFDLLLAERDRDAYLNKPATERGELLCQLLNRMVLDPDLYDPHDFAALELPAAITEPLEREQRINAEIARIAAAPANSERAARLLELKHRRMSVQSQVLLNQQLMARAFPAHFDAPAPVGMQRWLDVAALALAWVLSGAILAAGIAMIVFEPGSAEPRPSPRLLLMRSIGRGVIVAAVAAPLAVAAYVLIARLGLIVFDLAADKGATGAWIWRKFSEGNGVLGIPVAPVLLLYKLAHWFPFSWILVPGVLGALVWFRRRWVARVPLIWLSLGLIVLVVAPLSLPGLGMVMLLTAIIWIIPGIILGAAAPFLKPGSALPAVWGPIGIAGGVVLAVATIWRFDEWWWLALPAVLLVFVGLLIRARWNLEDYWPALALVVCLSIAGSTALLEQASFRGVLQRIHTFADMEQPEDGMPISGRKLANEVKVAIDASQAKAGAIVPDGKGGFVIARFTSPLQERLKEAARIEEENDLATTRLLEIVLVSALGFWAMIGLLAAWSLRKTDEVVR